MGLLVSSVVYLRVNKKKTETKQKQSTKMKKINNKQKNKTNQNNCEIKI